MSIKKSIYERKENPILRTNIRHDLGIRYIVSFVSKVKVICVQMIYTYITINGHCNFSVNLNYNNVSRF